MVTIASRGQWYTCDKILLSSPAKSEFAVTILIRFPLGTYAELQKSCR